MRPSAFYTVCRGALVAASQAIWVLAGSQDARLRRVRLLELEEMKSVKEFWKDYQRDESLQDDTSPELMAKVKAELETCVHRERELSRELKPQRGEATVTAMLRETARRVANSWTDPQVFTTDDSWVRRAVMYEWRTASADAHARLWQRAFRPGTVVPIIGQGTLIRYTGATAQSYGQSLGAATMTTSVAWQLWDQQRLV